MAGTRLWIFIIIMLLVLLVGGVYGYTWYSNSGSLHETNTVGTQTISQPLRGHIENITEPPLKFRGPTSTGEIPGLKITVTLSNSSVRVGETLWMKVKLIGGKAYSVKLLGLSIANSKGQKVYDTYVWLPHRTLAPGAKVPREETYNIAWRALRHPSANIDVAPGNYTFIVKASLNGKEVIVKGLVEVVK